MHKPKTKLNVPGLRARRQTSGCILYAYEPPQERCRREISLGRNFNSALLARAQILFNIADANDPRLSHLEFLCQFFSEAVLPTKSPKMRVEMQRAIAFVQKYSEIGGLRVTESVRIENQADYLVWRGPKAQLRGKREWSLVSVIQNWKAKLRLPLVDVDFPRSGRQFGPMIFS